MDKNKIESIISRIKTYNMITDLNVLYNMDTKAFNIIDGENRLLNDLIVSINEFHYFIDKLNELSLWDSDYELDFKIMKF